MKFKAIICVMLVGVFTMGHAATSHSNRDKDIVRSSEGGDLNPSVHQTSRVPVQVLWVRG